MATRLWFTSNAFAGPVYPADSNWDDTSQSTTQSSDLSSTPSGDAPFAQSAQKNSASNPHSILHIRYRYALPTGILFTGNIRGQHFGQCPSSLGGMRAISVRIFDSGTTVRATLLQDFAGALSSGFPGTNTNRFFPPSTPMATTYTTVAGDVLVVELGTKWFTAASGVTVTSSIRFGDNGVVDLPVDETTGVAAPEQNGWIEFENVNLFGSLDDPLPTFSGSAVTIRPPAPSKPGLHFFDRSTGIESIWDATVWKQMVASLNANGGTVTGGNFTLNNTTSINVALSGTTLTWTQNYAAPSGGYGTSATAGTAGTTSIASDARFVFPEALGTLADRTKILTLTASSSDAALSAASAFGSNTNLLLFAPGQSGVNCLAVGQYGNISIAQGASNPLILMNFQKTDYNETSTVSAISGNITNTGATGGGVKTLNMTATLSTGAGVTNSTAQIGNFLKVVQSAASATAVSSGAMTGLQIQLQGVRGANYTCGDVVSLDIAPLAFTRGNFTNLYGIKIAGITPTAGGTPTVQNAIEIGSMPTGTTRRSVHAVNTFETTANDFLCGTTAKGLICKDSQGTAEYWRFYMDSTGTKGLTYTQDVNGYVNCLRTASPGGNVTLNVQDTGTTNPAT